MLAGPRPADSGNHNREVYMSPVDVAIMRLGSASSARVTQDWPDCSPPGHVHDEIMVNGRFVDPMRIKLPRGRSLEIS